MLLGISYSLDRDECAEMVAMGASPCNDQNQECIDTPGKYYCGCKDGYNATEEGCKSVAITDIEKKVQLQNEI